MNPATDTPIDRLARHVESLYTLPGVAMEVIELTSSPKVDTGQLKACIENDPALTSKILRAVNSSLFGLSRRVKCLRQAIALLGIKPLKLLVLGFSLPQTVSADLPAAVLANFWKRSLTRAVTARELADRFYHASGDEAFLAGMLHGLGQLVLLEQLGAPYVRLVERLASHGGNLADCERRAIGFEHVELTVRVLTNWRLHERVIRAINLSRHGQGDPTWGEPAGAAAEDPLAQVVRLADGVAELVVDRQPAQLRLLLDVAGRAERIKPFELCELIEQVQARVAELAGILAVELPEGQQYNDVLAKAQRLLSGVAADVAVEFAAGHAVVGTEVTLLQELQATAAALSLAGRRDLSAPAAAAGSLASPALAAVGGGKRAAGARTKAAAAVDLAADHPQLFEAIKARLALCRREQCELSLLLIERPQFEDLVFERTVDGAEAIMRHAIETCREEAPPGGAAMRVRDNRLALVLPGCDRMQAARLGNELLRRLTSAGGNGAAVPWCGGAASVVSPARNFAIEDLVGAAERCLKAATSGGGGTVKSIEILG